MTYAQAKQELEHALNNQKTIEITKLKELMDILNMSIEPTKDEEIAYLKKEVKSLSKKLNVIERNMRLRNSAV